MGYKNSDPCIQKAFEDERLFVLMARDVTAPTVIAYWIKLNEGIQPEEKLIEAEACMKEMLERGAEFRKRKEATLPLFPPLPTVPEKDLQHFKDLYKGI